MQFNSQFMYMHMKSNQMKGSIIILFIFKLWKTCFPIHFRYSIWKMRNVSTIHRIIPCRQRTHLDKWIYWIKSSNITIFWQWSRHRNSKNWILWRWSRQVKDAQPCWYLTILHHQQSNLKLCRLYPGKIWTFVPRQRRQFVSSQNVPRLWKGRFQGNSKNHFRMYLWPNTVRERSLTIYKVFILKIFNQRHSEGQISDGTNRTSLF